MLVVLLVPDPLGDHPLAEAIAVDEPAEVAEPIGISLRKAADELEVERVRGHLACDEATRAEEEEEEKRRHYALCSASLTVSFNKIDRYKKEATTEQSTIQHGMPFILSILYHEASQFSLCGLYYFIIFGIYLLPKY